MKGKLFGIGAGPGDPDLLTLKAVKKIKKCSVIAIPNASNGQSTVWDIIKKYAAEKELLKCSFTMAKDLAKRKKARVLVASKIMRLLDEGKDVGFVTLGDPATYSTYMYVHKIIAETGYDTEIIPGITSYAAAAAALGIALCEDDEALTIIPAKHRENIDKLLDYPGNKVVMKSGENLTKVLEKLKERGLDHNTKIAYRVTMSGQQLYSSAEDYEKSPKLGYLTVAIVKEKQ